MPQSPGTVIFDGLPKEPFFETRHSCGAGERGTAVLSLLATGLGRS
jgi:hypothetical protein